MAGNLLKFLNQFSSCRYIYDGSYLEKSTRFASAAPHTHGYGVSADSFAPFEKTSSTI